MRMFAQGHSCHRGCLVAVLSIDDKDEVTSKILLQTVVLYSPQSRQCLQIDNEILDAEWAVSGGQTDKEETREWMFRDVDWVTHVNPRWVWVRAWVELSQEERQHCTVSVYAKERPPVVYHSVRVFFHCWNPSGNIRGILIPSGLCYFKIDF